MAAVPGRAKGEVKTGPVVRTGAEKRDSCGLGEKSTSSMLAAREGGRPASGMSRVSGYSTSKRKTMPCNVLSRN